MPFLPLSLLATGKALPARIVSSAELDERLGKPRGYVQKRSGIVHRHHAEPGLLQSDLAARAVRDACARGGIAPESIDLLINVNGVPEQALPCTAAHVLAALGWRGRAGYDLNASCVGFLPALQHAAALLNSGCHRRIAIVACDLASRGLNWADEESSLIFGDGAAAAIVERGCGEGGIRRFVMKNYPDAVSLCQIPAGGTRRNMVSGMRPQDFYFKMHGRELFRRSAEVLPEILGELLAGMSIADCDLWLVHQASHLGMQHITKRLGISERRLVNIYPTHGNQVSASLPTVLHEAFTGNLWQRGSRVAMVGTAAGLAVAGLIWEV
ncbi:3-oxoacyl-ACP synthase [Eikenella longinqua]|uniref:3-oxoacyl-ACP synthase n=1 Tax=Eikenella longinqua TaxID=1795827 RepID=A0A1A9RXJ8_9NEIS|nr:ketoacyl-ACP synthase III [Eikenella longinqua]OAM29174.1 3-oxoacyl-ACP synthase [Eikenella longinqua]